MDKNSDVQLIENVLGGDIESFGRLCSTYYSSMVAIGYSVLTDHHLAEEAAQETFARALKNLKNLKSKEKFTFWLGGICRNVAKDMANKRSRVSNTDDFSLLSDDHAQNQDRRAVTLALKSLSLPERELIAMRYYDNLSYEQISDVLGLSKPAINGRLSRARKKMAKYLQKTGFGEVKL